MVITTTKAIVAGGQKQNNTKTLSWSC